MTNEKAHKPAEDRRETERKKLLALHAKQPLRDDSREPGVLLSDVIREYVHWFELISPFNERNLKPACYKLTIGDEYAIGGKIYPLSDQPGANVIRIPPFAVAIVKTKETINMPPFLIGRWNIQVSRAYQGLLWVGGPQVDAGYAGHLFCPIYNLSDKEVSLYHGEPIAVIDFEKTTKFNESKSIRYPEVPDKIVFEDYKPHVLGSGLVTHAAKIEQFEPKLKSVQERVDSFVSLTFAVIAVLFAAVTIFVTRVDQAWFWNPEVFLVSGTALFLSASAWVRARNGGKVSGWMVLSLVLMLLLAGTVLLFSAVSPQQRQVNDLSRKVDQLEQQMKTPPSAPSVGAQPPTPHSSAGAKSVSPKRVP